MRILDISLPISEDMTIWPGQPSVSMAYVRHLARGDHATVGRISMTLHTGTHVDAPAHHFLGGAGADELDLDALVGPALVVHMPAADQITAEALDGLDITASTERLLIRTRNSELWSRENPEFSHDYVGLSEDAAGWLRDRGFRLVGTDYLSVVAWTDLVPAHRVLLGSGVVLLEGLDLREVAPGPYDLICLPLRVAAGDGAPARAVLIEA